MYRYIDDDNDECHGDMSICDVSFRLGNRGFTKIVDTSGETHDHDSDG